MLMKLSKSRYGDTENSRERMTETKVVYRIGNLSVLLLQDREHSPNVACAALLFLLVSALLLNSSVLLSLVFSNLKSNPYNASVATLAAVSVFDGIFNVTSSIVFHASWDELAELYGETGTRKWCRVNATTLQFTGMVQSFVLAVLVYERWSSLVVRSEENVRRKNLVLTRALFGSVAVSVLMSLPISFGTFTTTLFENRMSCSPIYVTEKRVTLFLAVPTIVTYLGTWLFTLHVWFLVIRRLLNNRRRLLDLSLVARQAGTTETNSFGGESNSSRVSGTDEHPLYILTGLLLVSFMVAVWPNIIAVQVTQFRKTRDESLDSDFLNQTLQSGFGQIETDVFDSVFAWTRCGYNVFLPVAVFLVHSEARKQCRMTFCCCGKTHDFSELNEKETTKSVTDNAIPVLFATSEGLHLRILNQDSLTEEPSYTVKFCDLVVGEHPKNGNQTREMALVKFGEDNVKESKLSETFVVTPRGSFGGTYIKLTKGFDISNGSKYGKSTIELDVIEENSKSASGLPQNNT